MTKNVFTLDLGNSNPHVGYFESSQLVEVMPWNEFRKKWPADKLSSKQLIKSQVGNNPEGLEDYLAFCQVVPKLHTNLFLDMPVCYSETLGLDRLYQAYLAYKKFASTGPVAVIDAGTFITMDLIDTKGFQGGYIFPGLTPFLSSYRQGSQLPTLKLDHWQTAENLPQTTEAAILQATQFYLQKIVSGFLDQTSPTKLILTGGAHGLIESALNNKKLLKKFELISEPHFIHEALFKIFVAKDAS